MERRLKVLSIETNGKGSPPPPARLAVDLSEAIAHQEIAVQFQPQFDLRSGRGCGVEALARWRSGNGRETPPSTFIPIAERFGLIGAIGVSVLHQACAAVCAWQPLDPAPTLSVNVSTRQISENFCALLANVLKISDFPAHRLELELTESALMTDPDVAVRTLSMCKQIGVSLALDDFGTGYSSLNYLARLPLDRLKLDKTFIHRMLEEARTAAIVRAVIALGADIGMTIVAEGVESEAQLEMLERMGCPQVQGNLLGRPVSGAEAFALLSRPWGSRHGGLHAA